MRCQQGFATWWWNFDPLNYRDDERCERWGEHGDEKALEIFIYTPYFLDFGFFQQMHFEHIFNDFRFFFFPPFGTSLLWIESAQTCFYNMFRVNTFYFQSYTYLKTLETGHRCYSTWQHTKAQTQSLFSGLLSLTFRLWTQSSCKQVDWLMMVSHPRDNGNVLSF